MYAKYSNQYILFYIYISSGILLAFKSVILVYAICCLREFIKTIQFAMPNELLMLIHFTNVTIYILLLALSAIFYIIFVYRTNDGSECEAAKHWFGFSLVICLQAIF